MYWKDRLGKIHLITEMSLDYLQNCKSMLERNDIRIETLSKPSSDYANILVIQVCKDEYESSIDYCYTTSPEYSAICMEIRRRLQV